MLIDGCLAFSYAQVDAALSRTLAAQTVACAASAPILPLVIFLVHCPPESLHLGFPYHAIPVNNWEFVFCDAVSLRDVAAVAGSDVDATLSNYAPSDPRRWISSAYGLINTLPSSSVESRSEFTGFFDDALSQVSSYASWCTRNITCCSARRVS